VDVEAYDLNVQNGATLGGNLDAGGNSLTNVGAVETDESRTSPRTITVNVPTDFSTVDAAIDKIGSVRASPGLQFVINIESGHNWQQEVVIQNEDLSHVKITSEDAEVQYDNTGISVAVASINAHLPQWDVLYVGHGNGNGLDVSNSSSIYIHDGAGVKNTTNGIKCNDGAVVYGNGLISKNNSDRGISATSNCWVVAENADLSDNGIYGVRAGGGSRVDVKGATITNIGGNNSSAAALRANNHSKITAHNSDVSDSAWAIRCSNSYVYATGATANNLQYGIVPDGAGFIVNFNGKTQLSSFYKTAVRRSVLYRDQQIMEIDTATAPEGSTTEIHETNSGQRFVKLDIYGEDNDASSRSFHDTVVYSPAQQSAQRKYSTDFAGPYTRSYGVNANENLELTAGSNGTGDYELRIRAVGFAKGGISRSDF
jgi:hypothetical protein